MAQCDRSEPSQKLGVLGLIPVRSELIRRTYEERTSVQRQRLGWLEPSPKRLFRKFLFSAIKQTGPDFARSQGH
jgi:hypothetical protein